MRAELVLMGKRVDMAPQTHRRALVCLIYATLAALAAGFFLLDGWRTSGLYVVIATFLLNRFFLGGYSFGGLIKPFTGKPPTRSQEPPPFLLLALRLYQPAPTEREYESDERELQQRDRAHYKAYQFLATALALLWMLTGMNAFCPTLFARIAHGAPALLLYGAVMAALVAALTLPQAILLWTEPDMEEDSE